MIQTTDTDMSRFCQSVVEFFLPVEINLLTPKFFMHFCVHVSTIETKMEG